jgi:hypothetical protein
MNDNWYVNGFQITKKYNNQKATVQYCLRRAYPKPEIIVKPFLTANKSNLYCGEVVPDSFCFVKQFNQKCKGLYLIR